MDSSNNIFDLNKKTNTNIDVLYDQCLKNLNKWLEDNPPPEISLKELNKIKKLKS